MPTEKTSKTEIPVTTIESGEAYSEIMTARVNVEGSHREVILRGTDSVNTIFFGNQKGTEHFENGQTYLVSFTKQ